MKKQNHILKYILSFCLVLAAFLLVSQHGAVAYAAGDKIYYFNMDDNGLEGSMMLVESSGHWGLVDAGHRNAQYMRDYTSGDVLYASPRNGLSSQVYCRNGKDVANYMINQLGVTHLDFIVGTHAHSDHIGGIPEIAQTSYKDSSGKTKYLVDSNTTYYYKEYQHISDIEDDLVRYSSNSWHNQAFASQAVVAMQDRGASLVDVSKTTVIHGDPGNTYGDYITFTVGNMSFRLYNVYEQTNTGDENVNSIVTVMTNGNYTVVNLADINTNNGAIDKTSQAIAKAYGDVDIVVAGHHGYAGSNTKTMFDSLQPSFVVVPNGQDSSWLYTDCDLAAAIPYAKGKYGTDFYNLSISQYAVVTDLSGRQVYVYTVNGSGNLTNAISKMMKSANKTGWVSWMQTNGTLWSYLEKGNSVKNAWRRVDGKMYRFDKDGIMQTGWYTDSGGTRYLDSSGALVVGWDYLNGKWYFFEDQCGYKLTNCWRRINGKMYRFDKDGIMQTGWYADSGGTRYLDSSGALTVGWKQINGKWYFFEDSKGYRLQNKWQRINGKMYRFGKDGIMQTGWYTDSGGTRYLDENGVLTVGWKQIKGKWYFFEDQCGYRLTNTWKRIGKYMYYFDGDGSMHTGWHTDSGGTRYLNSSGALVTGWQKVGGVWYFFEDTKGYKQTLKGWYRLEGSMHFFDTDGTMRTGWYNNGTGTRYLNPEDGALAVGWEKIGGKWYYFEDQCGYRLQNTWQRIGKNMYFFNADGSMHIGWHTDSGGTRYLDENGVLAVGWKQIGGKWYYFEDQCGYRLQNKWQRIDNKMYRFNADGSMHTGWYTDSGGTRYLNPSGVLVVGWQKIDGAWYFFEDQNGYKENLNGWYRLDGSMHYFKAGVMQTGWLTIENKTRFLDSDGALAVGWRQIGGAWYFFEDQNGYRLENCWQRYNEKMYYFDGEGVMQTGWLQVYGKTRYLDSSGAMLVGWQQIGGKWYYFSTEDGNMARNTTIDGYYVNADGVWVQ